MDSSDFGAEHSTEDFGVSLADIIDYIGEASRPLKEGSAVFDANHVRSIGYTINRLGRREVVARVTRSSNPREKPHEVVLKLGTDISGWVLKCSCRAGTQKCKHVIACLLHLEKDPMLEYMSCTDIKQAWGTTKSEKRAEWDAKRVSDMCCVPKQKPLNTSDVETLEDILKTSFSRILNVSKNSAIFKHTSGRYLNIPKIYPNRAMQGVISDCLTMEELESYLTKPSSVVLNVAYSILQVEEEYYNRNIRLSLPRVIELAVETQEQNTNLWKILRSKRITASSAYNLFTYLSNKNPDWEKKISQYWEVKALKVAATKHGKDTEPLVFACYRRENPNVKKCGLVIHPTEGWIAGSPDGFDPSSGIILEIKCPMNKEATLVEILTSKTVNSYIKKCPNSENFELNRLMYIIVRYKLICTF
ncbi:uncharacterized protein LOC120430419 isoform X1 [Culex pipiens pallens]|uniref:uncharacterized protein LOC120430419 isoform X1 n=1 Tax=Culex pipiens pallens TaxID=42434 RepID=UPI001954D11A|nr:uncharacterized protein LOC120430419 isoform X1 [Culex pipiens pallens]